MTGLLANLRNAVAAGFVLAALVFLIYLTRSQFNGYVFWPFFVRWLHIMCGVMWIGLLWYFNFVQTPIMGRVPDELKPAVSRYIAPEALFWFRWAAMFTIVFGIVLAAMNGYLLHGYLLDADEGFTDVKIILIGIGMWLGTIMWFNVWFVIWPNQKRALNLENAFSDLTADQKAKAARIAGFHSRLNTVLSIPMLFCMAAATHIFTG